MRFTAVLALALMHTAPAFAAYLCMMKDGTPNNDHSICTNVGGNPYTGYEQACCIYDNDDNFNKYDTECKKYGGVRAQYSYVC